MRLRVSPNLIKPRLEPRASSRDTRCSTDVHETARYTPGYTQGGTVGYIQGGIHSWVQGGAYREVSTLGTPCI